MWRLGTLQRRKSIPPSTVTPTRVFLRETTISKGANTPAMSLPRTPSGRQHHWREGGGDADIDGLSARVNHSGTSANGTTQTATRGRLLLTAQLRWNPVKDGLKPQELVYDILSPSLEEGCRKARLGVWVGLWKEECVVACWLSPPPPSPNTPPPDAATPPPPPPAPGVQPLPLPPKENLASLPRAEPGDILRFKQFFLHTYARMVLWHVVLRLADQ